MGSKYNNINKSETIYISEKQWWCCLGASLFLHVKKRHRLEAEIEGQHSFKQTESLGMHTMAGP